MTLSRYAKKRDANEPAIVSALESDGFVVYRIDQPVDLLVCSPGYPTWLLLEVKSGTGRLTDAQVRFWRQTEGSLRFQVTTPQQARKAAWLWILGREPDE